MHKKFEFITSFWADILKMLQVKNRLQNLYCRLVEYEKRWNEGLKKTSFIHCFKNALIKIRLAQKDKSW